MQQNALKELHKLVRGKILCNVPLSRYTSLRVGGPAEIMIYPLNIMELQKVINFSHTHPGQRYQPLNKGWWCKRYSD